MRKQRKLAGLTLGGLAKAVGVSTSYISDLEHGRRAPLKTEQILRIARALDCDPEGLLVAAAAARGEVTVSSKDSQRMNLAIGFARALDHMSPEQVEAMRKIIAESAKGEGDK